MTTKAASLRRLLFLALLLPLPAAFSIDYRGLPQWSHQKQGSTEYMLYTPTNLAEGQRYPIAIFLHGCCGDDDEANLRNAVDPPARMWHQLAANQQSVPTYIISPATSRGWERHFSNLIDAVESLIQEGQGDRQRIYLSGFSMGGRGIWRFLQQYPDYFAAAIPMGMGFEGDPAKVKDVPIWAIRGEDDWWARDLPEAIAEIRALNGYPGGAETWVTGVNPRFSDFEGVGHAVQWPAVSSLDLTAWAYSKVNDGNRYPHVYFSTPAHRSLVHPGQPVEVTIEATDPDGAIERVDLILNGKAAQTLRQPPFQATLRSLAPHDNLVEAVAFDNQGKSSRAQLVLQHDSVPAIDISQPLRLPRGRPVDRLLPAQGNAPLRFALADHSDPLPQGLSLSHDGHLTGRPSADVGPYFVKITVADAQGDLATHLLPIYIGNKVPGNVLVTGLRPNASLALVAPGVQLFSGPNDEINFSDTAGFDGMVFIQTDPATRNDNGSRYLSFSVDTEVDLYLAYETFGHEKTSTVPDWLSDFKQLPDREIEAQYRYFDVYHRRYPEGTINLPGANAEANGVESNYLVILAPANP